MKALILILLIASTTYAVQPEDLRETRYTLEVQRYSNGRIKRSKAVVRAFKRIHPCPVTPCLGWQVDHVIPLACGGKDSVSNMQWLPVHIKTCAGPYCKDRFERKIYGLDPAVLGAGNCNREGVR